MSTIYRVTGDESSPVELLTVSEVAAVLRISRMSVYRLIHGGELSALKCRGTFRVRRDALDDYLLAADYAPERPARDG